jgi:hypothetical protein
MSFGNVIEQVLQQGMAGQSRAPLEHGVGPNGLGGVPGLDELLGAVLDGQAPGRSAGGGLGGGPSGHASTGGLGDLLGSVLAGATRGTGGTGGTGGGLDDLLGSVLGGGQREAPPAALAAVRAWPSWRPSRWRRCRHGG